MTQELYIDGKRLDLFPDTEIALQYRSNIFDDIDKITSSNSLTISLPKTPNNDIAMKFADLPIRNTQTLNIDSYVRKWYSAVFVRSGLPIIRGRAALLSATPEAYEITLVWGAIEWLQKWVGEGKSIRELPITATLQLKKYSPSIFSSGTGLRAGYYYYDNGKEEYAFPVVSVKVIFDAIIANLTINNAIDTSAVDYNSLLDYYINFNEDLVKELNVSERNPEPTFEFVKYLPDISQVDFIKAICHLKGWYIEATPTGIMLQSYNNVIANTSYSVDWSDKLISEGMTPDVMEFSFGDYAQRNWMRYEKDDTVDIDADGYIAVDDDTLDFDKDLFTLPFAATANGNRIRQYRTTVGENGEKEVEFIKTKPRILRVKEDVGLDEEGDPIPGLWFDVNDYFSTIVNIDYLLYGLFLYTPRVITVRLRLDDVDLLNLDMSKCVYIGRYANYFHIIELQNQGGITIAKLLKVS